MQYNYMNLQVYSQVQIIILLYKNIKQFIKKIENINAYKTCIYIFSVGFISLIFVIILTLYSKSYILVEC